MSNADVIGFALGVGSVAEVGSLENVTDPATGVALLPVFDWYRTVAVKVAVNAPPPAGARPDPGMTNFGSPVESTIGATLNVAIAGYAVGDGVGVIDTEEIFAPLRPSDASVT